MWYEVHEAFQATFQKTSIACFNVFWIQYLFCVLASVPHCAVYRETVNSSLGRWRLLIFHCILTSVTSTSQDRVCVSGGGGGKGTKRKRVCVYDSVCVVSGGGGEECLVCADDDNMKGGEGWAQTDCASQNQTQTRFVFEFRPSLRHNTSVYRNKQASAASF